MTSRIFKIMLRASVWLISFLTIELRCNGHKTMNLSPNCVRSHTYQKIDTERSYYFNVFIKSAKCQNILTSVNKKITH